MSISFSNTILMRLMRLIMVSLNKYKLCPTTPWDNYCVIVYSMSILLHGVRSTWGVLQCVHTEYPENAFCMCHSYYYLPLLHQGRCWHLVSLPCHWLLSHNTVTVQEPARKKKSTIFIGTDSFCIDDLFYYEHALTSVPVYFYKQPHLQSMDADMSRIRVGDDMDFLSFIYSVLWTDIYKKGYFKCVNSAVNVELSEFKSIYTHSWHCI